MDVGGLVIIPCVENIPIHVSERGEMMNRQFRISFMWTTFDSMAQLWLSFATKYPQDGNFMKLLQRAAEKEKIQRESIYGNCVIIKAFFSCPSK